MLDGPFSMNHLPTLSFCFLSLSDKCKKIIINNQIPAMFFEMLEQYVLLLTWSCSVFIFHWLHIPSDVPAAL